MDSLVAERLIALNREFYDRFGGSFSATRRKLQPGVNKTLGFIRKEDSIIDLGCGNGHFLAELARHGHQGALLGVDFSLPLLRDAGSMPGVSFREVDLTKLPEFTDQLSDEWDLITAFAVLHHIPSNEMRLDILRTIQKLLKPGGRFILSNWQFLNSEKLKSRIQPWTRIGLSDRDVDPGDHLLDWRSGGKGLRYVHHFSAGELTGLAGQAGMRVRESFLSDGENGRLGLYQVWASS
jgi:tRNA (uracil-5-)-methyltransferase TRM9